MDRNAGMVFEADPGGFKKVMWLEISTEFNCKALSGDVLHRSVTTKILQRDMLARCKYEKT